MRRFIICMATVAALGLSLVPLVAFPHRSEAIRETQKRHRKENKVLKQQQRAMKNVMKQHAQTSDSNQRFKSNMKIQRQLAKGNQRQETRRQKQQGK